MSKTEMFDARILLVINEFSNADMDPLEQIVGLMTCAAILMVREEGAHSDWRDLCTDAWERAKTNPAVIG